MDKKGYLSANYTVELVNHARLMVVRKRTNFETKSPNVELFTSGVVAIKLLLLI